MLASGMPLAHRDPDGAARRATWAWRAAPASWVVSPHRLSRRRRSSGPTLVLLLSAGALAGCATAPSTDLAGFGRTAGALRVSADASFGEANRLSRTVEIDAFVRSGGVALTERRFPPAVPTEVIAAWRSALGDLARYGALLGTLSDGRGGEQSTVAFRDLGVQLNAGGTRASIDPGIAAGFSALAGALVDLAAREKAQSVIRRTDPQVRSLLVSMAAAIGAGDSEGLRGTVASNWAASLANTQRAYATAATEKAESRQRTIIADYLAGIDARDAQLRSLADLRASLLALGDAHAAAAAGSRRPFDQVLSDVNRRVGNAEAAYRAVEQAGNER